VVGPSERGCAGAGVVGRTLLVGQGSSLRWLDVATLTSSRQLTTDMSIDAVALLEGGTRSSPERGASPHARRMCRRC
jgi:hypothetical protein